MNLNKKIGVIFLILVIILYSNFVAGASFTVNTDCAESKTLLKISNGAGGKTNAHAETYSSATGSYQNKICYTGTASSSRTCSGNNGILKLSATTNAHAEVYTNNNYGTSVCYGGLTCGAVNGECTGASKCVVKLSATTNAHLSDCTDASYPVSICCNDVGQDVDGGVAGGENTRQACSDNKDNDGDGKFDCTDDQCATQQNCKLTISGREICNDNTKRDEDDDGYYNCADSDCKNSIYCGGTEGGSVTTPMQWYRYENELKGVGGLNAFPYKTTTRQINKYDTGKEGKGLLIDQQSAAAELASGSKIGHLPKFTIMAWVKLDSSKGQLSASGWYPIISEYNGNVEGKYYLAIKDNRVVFHPNNNNNLFADGTFNNAWTHIAVVVNTTSTTEEIALYVNGQKKTTKGDNTYPGIAATAGTNYGALVGATKFNGNPDGFFGGIIDDVKIYDNALTLGQINTAMQATEYCYDNLDNDGDGAKDCGDSDCRRLKNNCVIPPDSDEINCSNEIDDEGGDILIDCADSDCKDNVACTGTPGDGGGGAGGGCSENSDCPSGQECSSGRCRIPARGEGCSTNQACPENKICDIRTNTCEDSQCTVDAECGEGRTCDLDSHGGRCFDCNADSDHDGTNDCDDPCSLIIGDDEDECEANRDRYAVTCDDIGGVDCTGGDCIGHSEGYESTRSILCCVPTPEASAGEQICAPTETYLSALGSIIRFEKGICIDEDGDGEGTVTVKPVKEGSSFTESDAETLGITLDPDGTYKEQCTTIPQNYEGPVTPFFTYGSLVLTLLLLGIFYLFRKR